eukprot:scaffold18648_cov124-Isochrysis_galbana.AAC.11
MFEVGIDPLGLLCGPRKPLPLTDHRVHRTDFVVALADVNVVRRNVQVGVADTAELHVDEHIAWTKRSALHADWLEMTRFVVACHAEDVHRVGFCVTAALPSLIGKLRNCPTLNTISRTPNLVFWGPGPGLGDFSFFASPSATYAAVW